MPGVPFIGIFAGGEYGPMFAGSAHGPGQAPGAGLVPGEAPGNNGHSYHTATRPHGLPQVDALFFSSAVAMFG